MSRTAPWLTPVLQTLADNHMDVVRIVRQEDSALKLDLKPTHCASSLKKMNLSLVLTRNGTSEIVLPAGRQTLDQRLTERLTQIQTGLSPHLTILAQIDVVAQNLPSHRDIATKFYENPWAVYITQKLTRLPHLALSQLNFCESPRGPYARFNFNCSEPGTPNYGILLSFWPRDGWRLTDNPSEHDGSLIVTRFLKSASECTKTVPFVHRLAQTGDNVETLARTLFHYPGLITCASIAVRNGATLKGATVYPENDASKPIAELRLAHPKWATAEGQTPTLRLGQSGRMEHNILAGERTSLSGAMDGIRAYLTTPGWMLCQPNVALFKNDL